MTTYNYPAPPAMAGWAQTRAWGSFTDGSPSVWQFADNGRALPPLVLLPGALGDARSAWRLAEAFDERRRVIAVTYPGGCDALALADGLAALLQTLDTGPCAIWGSSYGAWWAQAFAFRHPEMTQTLWLGNTFVDGADVASAPLFNAEWLSKASAQQVQERWHEAFSSRPDDELRAAQLHLLHHTLTPEQLHGRLRQVAGAPALVPATTARMVVSNCTDDPVIDAEVRARVMRRYPSAQPVSLDAGGHYPHITAVEQLVPAMLAWLSIP